jgi:acyl dehydratase
MQRDLDSIATIKCLLGQPAIVSEPVLVDQGMIDKFADVTQDLQWIHIDTKRAASESPYGSTIAHGLLTLALIPAWYKRCFAFSNRKIALNNGFDKIRFLAPVPSGSELIGSFQLVRVDDLNANEIKVFWQVEVRIHGSGKLAMVATWITQLRY